MRTTTPKRPRPRAATLAIGIIAVAALAPATAQANITDYFQSPPPLQTGVSGRVGDQTRTYLTSSLASSNCGTCTIWAGAHYPGGLTLYASWASGTGQACHNYGQDNLGAMIEAPYTAQNIFAALAGWTGNNGPSYC